MLERLHLEIIRELNNCGSLTQAAEKLFLTQSALTHSIKKLEGLLGTKIWIKEGRGLRLTSSGQYLLKTADHLLPQFLETEKVLEAFGRGVQGQLRIGVECHPCYEWLLQIISGFLKEWQQVEIDVTRSFQFGGMDALINHQVDLVITPDRILHDALYFVPVLDFELQLLLSAEHPLASKSHIMPADLQPEILYTYPVPVEKLDVYTQFLIPAETQVQNRKQIEATDIMLQLIETGRGVGTFPDWLIKRYRETMNVKGLRLGEKGIRKELFMVIREEDTGVEYIKDFIERGKRGF